MYMKLRKLFLVISEAFINLVSFLFVFCEENTTVMNNKNIYRES